MIDGLLGVGVMFVLLAIAGALDGWLNKDRNE